MAVKQITLLGGTGFVGSHLIHRLAGLGHQVTLLTRRPERHREYRVGARVRMVQSNPYDTEALTTLFEGSDCIINLVGILNQTGSSTFSRVHVDLPRAVVKAMRESGVTRLLHMSALNADVNETHGRYLKTKGEGENLVHQSPGVDVTSFRPSVVFGPGDSFFNRFAGLLKIAPPPLFPLACAKAKFAPVFVENVVDAFVHALDSPRTAGKRLDLCGPTLYTLQQLVTYTAGLIGKNTTVVSLPDVLSRMQALLLGVLPGKLFTLDNYYSLQIDSVCSESAFAQLGIVPRSVEAVVPTYLGGARSRARYAEFRARARRTP